MATDELLDVDLDGPEQRRTWPARAVVALSAVALVVGGLAVLGGGDSDGDPEAIDGDDTVVGDVVVEIRSAGRADGLDSLRMPMLAAPDDGLVDQQVIDLAAKGFAPNVSVAIVQCAGIEGTSGGEGDCDVGGYTLDTTDGDGVIVTSAVVRRFISTSRGMVDCADPGELQCVVVVANINDYDESAVANIWFDANVEGIESPLIEVDRVDGLQHGDVVTVSGSGFPAETSVTIGQCTIGPGYGIEVCWREESRLGAVISDAAGEFSTTVEVSRTVLSSVDCFGTVYGCRIAARADVGDFVLGDGTAANPVRIWFDGTAPPEELDYGVAYAMNPDRNLTDGETLSLQLSNLISHTECVHEEVIDEYGDVIDVIATECFDVALDEGAIEVQQCLDLAAGEEYCLDPAAADIDDGAAELSITVVRFIARDSGELVDCASAAGRCELRLTGSTSGSVPLRFASDD